MERMTAYCSKCEEMIFIDMKNGWMDNNEYDETVIAEIHSEEHGGELE